MFLVHEYLNPTPVLISREGIAKRLDLAEERPPTEEDYCDQLAIRFGVKLLSFVLALKSTSSSLRALEKLEHVTLSPSPHLLIFLAQHLPLDTCKEEETVEELLTPWSSISHHIMASKLLDRLASTQCMVDDTDQEDVDKVTLLLIKEDRRLLTRSLQLLQGELQEVSTRAKS